jgi:threonine dehydratase
MPQPGDLRLRMPFEGLAMIESLPERTEEAGCRIYTINRRTPLDYSPWFSAQSGARVHFKMESLQYTGSFKLRGVTNKLLALTQKERERGCIVASTGNHGAAAAYAMKRLGVAGEILVPHGASPAKVDAITLLGGHTRMAGAEPLETERLAREQAAREGKTYISPYNDVEVIAGQGTVGAEILEELPEVHAVYVAVGGGGLAGGIGAWFKRYAPDTRIVGCVPENAPVMAECVRAGRVVHCACRETLSDATAGNLEDDAVTVDLCRATVDEWILVSEEEIAAAIRDAVRHEHTLMEGAAGVALAAFRRNPGPWAGQDVVIVNCGRNIDADVLKRLL